MERCMLLLQKLAIFFFFFEYFGRFENIENKFV